MNREDLMIGINVLFDNEIVDIINTDFIRNIQFTPIKATPELFMNLDFKEVKEDLGLGEGNEWITYEACVNGYFVKISSFTNDKQWYVQVDDKRHTAVGGVEFDYIHELQIFLKLATGKMIKINKDKYENKKSTSQS